MNTLIVEIDKTIADISERERRARSHTEARVRELGARPGNERSHSQYISLLYSQEALYNPELVPLDTPIRGAVEALAQIRQAGYSVMIRTCRPHWMESATIAWLGRHAISYDQLQCKNFADRQERFKKNVVWKAEGVRLAASDHDQVLYVDADQRSVEAVAHVNLANIFTATSLAGLQLPAAAAPAPDDKTFYWRRAHSDYVIIDRRTNRIGLRLSTEERAQHFTDLWNFVVGPPHHCGSCGREVPEGEQMYGHSHYLSLCFACSCANEGD
jgi:hypothetical protein